MARGGSAVMASAVSLRGVSAAELGGAGGGHEECEPEPTVAPGVNRSKGTASLRPEGVVGTVESAPSSHPAWAEEHLAHVHCPRTPTALAGGISGEKSAHSAS